MQVCSLWQLYSEKEQPKGDQKKKKTSALGYTSINYVSAESFQYNKMKDKVNCCQNSFTSAIESLNIFALCSVQMQPIGSNLRPQD